MGNYLVSKRGQAQSAFPISRKPLEWCVKNIGLRPDNWRAVLRRKNLAIAKTAQLNWEERITLLVM